MQLKKAFASALLLAILAVSVGAIAVPVKAAVTGSVAVTKPNKVVPGGAIELELTDFSATGGTIYFYFSKNDDSVITSGDIRLTSIKRSDVEAELPELTIFVPTTVPAYEDGYYVKVSDSSTVGAGALVSDETVVVIPEEEWPTITVDPTSAAVDAEVDVKGSGISADYATADLYWDVYEDEVETDYRGLIKEDITVEDGEFTYTMTVPEAWMGSHKILVLLKDDDIWLGTVVSFDVKPSIEVEPPETYSILADELEQKVNITAHGFPKGTVKADTIKYIVKDFRTGSIIETITADHAAIDVEETPPGTFEDLLTVVDEVPEGEIDIQFTVGAKTFTLANQLLSSKYKAVGAFLAKMDKTSGCVGDEVGFSAIGFADTTTTVKIILDGPVYKEYTDSTGPDGNGAWKYTLPLPDMPGGKYTVRVSDVLNARVKTIGTFEVLPDIDLPDSAVVGDLIDIVGTGFPLDAEFKSIVVGTSKAVKLSPTVKINDTGRFEVYNFEVLHTSGGGKAQKVLIQGVDADGKAIKMEASITINPDLEAIEVLDYDGEWVDVDDVPLFGGTPMKFTGTGFLAGEAVTVTFANEVTATAKITYGGTAESDGDLEVVFQVPVGLRFAKTGVWDIKVAGKTATNKYTIEGVGVSALSNTDARIYFGLKPDGDLDTTVYVGDEVKIVGVGFATKSLTLAIDGEEVKSVTASYGYFETKIIIPELQRGDTYVVEETATSKTSCPFKVESKVTLTPAKASPGATVTAKGTGWVEDVDVDIIWEALPTLKTATPDEDGSWEATFTVPDVGPGTYRMRFVDKENYTVEATFYVLGPLRIVSLSLPSQVYNGSSVAITVNVQDFFGMAVAGATVTGSVTPPGAAAVSLTFTETAAGVYSATYAVPATAKEGSYLVSVKASKPEAGGDATASGTFYVSLKTPPAPPTPPVDISAILAAVESVTKDVSALSTSVSKLSTDLSGLKSDVSALSSSVSGLSSALADLKNTVAAIPIIPIELIYAILIISIIAAIAAIAAIIFIYRRIAA
jgi:hypothetical protein